MPDKHCRCCGRRQTLIDAHHAYVGVQRFDFVALHMWNCKCGSTMCLELPNPVIRQKREELVNVA